jgi:hypothetical protein
MTDFMNLKIIPTQSFRCTKTDALDDDFMNLKIMLTQYFRCTKTDALGGRLCES